MAEWSLSFRPDPAKRHALHDYQAAISAAFGPIATRSGELAGNPRDFYWRDHTITADHTIVVKVGENTRGEGDPEAVFEVRSARILDDAAFADRMNAWAALTAALAKLDCIETTYQYGIADIVADARREGETAIADRLVRETTEKLVADAPAWTTITFAHTPADRDVVLAACTVERITGATLSGPDLPESLRPFANLTDLTLHDLGSHALRGWSFPALQQLEVFGEVEPDDLAGLPALTSLKLNGPVRRVDPRIREVCPRLQRVMLYLTPFASDRDAIATLAAAWPGVAIDTQY